MARTQHRPHSALTGRRFGAFSSKTPDPGGGHPVGVLTQHRPHSGLTGRRYGSFAGKANSGSAWEFNTPTEVNLSGVFGASGNFQFTTAAPFSLVQTAPVALSGAFDASGDVATSSTSSPLTNAEMRQMFTWINELALIHGLVAGSPLRVTRDRRTAGAVDQTLGGSDFDATVSRN